jgi:hypothetical protein
VAPSSPIARTIQSASSQITSTAATTPSSGFSPSYTPTKAAAIRWQKERITDKSSDEGSASSTGAHSGRLRSMMAPTVRFSA